MVRRRRGRFRALVRPPRGSNLHREPGHDTERRSPAGRGAPRRAGIGAGGRSAAEGAPSALEARRARLVGAASTPLGESACRALPTVWGTAWDTRVGRRRKPVENSDLERCSCTRRKLEPSDFNSNALGTRPRPMRLPAAASRRSRRTPPPRAHRAGGTGRTARASPRSSRGPRTIDQCLFSFNGADRNLFGARRLASSRTPAPPTPTSCASSPPGCTTAPRRRESRRPTSSTSETRGRAPSSAVPVTVSAVRRRPARRRPGRHHRSARRRGTRRRSPAERGRTPRGAAASPPTSAPAVLAACMRRGRMGRGLERPKTAERRGLVDGAIVGLVFHGALQGAACAWTDVEFTDGDDGQSSRCAARPTGPTSRADVRRLVWWLRGCGPRSAATAPRARLRPSLSLSRSTLNGCLGHPVQATFL